MTHQGKASGRRRLRGAACAAGMAAALLVESGPPAPAASKADPRAGKEQFDKLCAVCHGGEGKGDGQALRGLPVRPKSFADPATFRAVPDQALFETIKKGGAALKKSPMMPPFGDQLKDAQVWDLVAYIKSLAPPAR